jgi:hypothetical protein
VPYWIHQVWRGILWYAKNHQPACFRFAIALVLLACALLVGLTLHTASEERRRLAKEWNQRSQKMMELATREEGLMIGQTRQRLLALAESAPVRSGNRRDCKKLLDELFVPNNKPKHLPENNQAVAMLLVIDCRGRTIPLLPTLRRAARWQNWWRSRSSRRG